MFSVIKKIARSFGRFWDEKFILVKELNTVFHHDLYLYWWRCKPRFGLPAHWCTMLQISTKFSRPIYFVFCS